MSAPKISAILPILPATPFLIELASFAIRTLRMTAGAPFELIVVESEGRYFDPVFCPSELRPDKYLNFTPGIGGVREVNRALDVASGEFILFTGTDIIPPGDWDGELLRVFSDYAFCGVAALSAFEPNFTIGPPQPLDLVVEGNFSPFMMWRKGVRLDEAFERVYCDSDMILRLALEGKRALRSCRKHVWHLGSVTNTTASEEHRARHAAALAKDERVFYERWGTSPLAQFAIMRGGAQIYGREHEAYTRPINLHYDPSKPAEAAKEGA